MANKIFQKIHAAKWIGAEQLRQIMGQLGFTFNSDGEVVGGDPSLSYAMTDTWANLVAAHAATPFAENSKLRCTSGVGFDVVVTGGLLFVSSPMNGKTTLSSAAGVATVNLHSGYGAKDLSLTENITSWSFTNLPSSGEIIEKVINVIQHASAAKTVVSPATSGRTAGGIAWVADTTLSSRETLVLRVDSSGVVTLFPTGKQV